MNKRFKLPPESRIKRRLSTHLNKAGSCTALLLAALLLTSCSALPWNHVSTPGDPTADASSAAVTQAVTAPDDVPPGEELPAEPAWQELEGKKVFRYALPSSMVTFDPSLVDTMPDSTIAYHLYEGLYREVGGETRPAGASDVSVSDDGLVYTFTLRPEARWSDGQPVTAADYEYGIRRRMDPATSSPAAYQGCILKNGAAVAAGELPVEELGVRAVSDHTLEITLDHPADYFLTLLQEGGFCAVRRDVAEEYGQYFCSSPSRQVYNGPFTLRAVGGHRIVLFKNPYYWDADNVKLDGVIISTAVDAESGYQMFKRGELDYCELPTSRYRQYPDAQRFVDGTVDFIAPNLDSKWLSNRNLRLAIQYAVDREDLNGLAHGGKFITCTRCIFPGLPTASGEDFGSKYPCEACPVTGDEQLAKEYLAAALEEFGCEASDITLRTVTTDSGGSRAEAEFFRKRIRAVLGINIALLRVPYSVRNAVLRPHSEEFDLVFAGVSPDYKDAMTYVEPFTSDSGWNFINFANEEYDALIASARTLSGAEREEALFAAEKILLEDASIFPYQMRSSQYLINEKISGLGTGFAGHALEYLYCDVAGDEAETEAPANEAGEAGAPGNDAPDDNAPDNNAQDSNAQDSNAQDNNAQDSNAQDAGIQGAGGEDAAAQDADAQGPDVQGAGAGDADAQNADAQGPDVQGADAVDADAQNADAQGPDVQGAGAGDADAQNADAQ